MSILELHPDKIRVEAGGCWTWIGALDSCGYGRVKHRGRNWSSHRLAFLLAEGYTPPRPLVMDHLCRSRACCNPDHLQVVTHKENVRRGIVGEVNAARQRAITHCPQGHEYDEANTYINPKGGRICRECNREAQRRYRERQRAA